MRHRPTAIHHCPLRRPWACQEKHHWDKTQRNTYLQNLEKCFRWLAENPQPGKHRSDIAEDDYSFPQGRHVIFYLIGQEGIEIMGVPHKKMDIVAYFLPG